MGRIRKKTLTPALSHSMGEGAGRWLVSVGTQAPLPASLFRLKQDGQDEERDPHPALSHSMGEGAGRWLLADGQPPTSLSDRELRRGYNAPFRLPDMDVKVHNTTTSRAIKQICSVAIRKNPRLTPWAIICHSCGIPKTVVRIYSAHPSRMRLKLLRWCYRLYRDRLRCRQSGDRVQRFLRVRYR